MSSRLARYSAMAAAAAIVILGLTFIGGKNKPTGTAWAIEQSLQALQGVRSAYVKCMTSTAHMARQNPAGTKKEMEDKVKSVMLEGWATSDDGVEESKARMDMYFVPAVNASGEAAKIAVTDPSTNVVVSVVPSTTKPAVVMMKRENACYSYSPGFNQVVIQDADSIHLFRPWPGPDFQRLKEDAQKPNTKWQEEYGKDEVTGRNSVFVRYVGKNSGLDASFWYQFDLESKLPVCLKAWDNPNWEGLPDVVMEMVYNLNIPDETFSLTISGESLLVEDTRKATPGSRKTFSVEIPGGTCKFPEIVTSALKAQAGEQPSTKSE